jgi:multicomponent Na+:H+ antiporter subunit C
MLEEIGSKYNYWIYILLMMIGFYAMITKRNLVKKIIGMNIFQTAIILFFISTSFKRGGEATLPTIEYGHNGGGEHATSMAQHAAHAVNVSEYMNPLPHVLMLTAIVVMVATLGVALALVIKIYQKYKTLEEDEILRMIR